MMKPGSLIYMLVCALTVFYVYTANARGFVPFTSTGTRAATSGSGGHHTTGTAGFFHK